MGKYENLILSGDPTVCTKLNGHLLVFSHVINLKKNLHQQMQHLQWPECAFSLKMSVSHIPLRYKNITTEINAVLNAISGNAFNE